MAGSLENRGKLRELIDKFQFDKVNVRSIPALHVGRDFSAQKLLKNR
jgi:hypothetical protein